MSKPIIEGGSLKQGFCRVQATHCQWLAFLSFFGRTTTLLQVPMNLAGGLGGGLGGKFVGAQKHPNPCHHYIKVHDKTLLIDFETQEMSS
jgi:hypothetical protein